MSLYEQGDKSHIISNCCLPDFFDKTLEGDAGEEAKDLLVSTVT